MYRDTKMRHRYRFSQKNLRKPQRDTFIGRGVALTVRTKTRRRYRAVFRRFVTYMVNNLRPLGLNALTEFLQECRAQGARGKTLNGYRCAILHVQREHGWNQFAADDGLVRAIKGYVYYDKQHGVPRGAITEDMLRQLWIVERRLALEFGVVFYAVLRCGQAKRYRSGDLTVGRNGRATLTVRTDKRSRAGNVYEETSTKEILLEKGVALLQAAARGVQHGELCFPRFDEAKMNEAIKRAALTCKWAAGVEFDGMHCLRHGGAQCLRAFVEETLRAMGNSAAMSAGTARWYTRLNEIRIELVNDV